jgi:hypothetical protein
MPWRHRRKVEVRLRTISTSVLVGGSVLMLLLILTAMSRVPHSNTKWNQNFISWVKQNTAAASIGVFPSIQPVYLRLQIVSFNKQRVTHRPYSPPPHLYCNTLCAVRPTHFSSVSLNRLPEENQTRAPFHFHFFCARRNIHNPSSRAGAVAAEVQLLLFATSALYGGQSPYTQLQTLLELPVLHKVKMLLCSGLSPNIANQREVPESTFSHTFD